MAKQLTEKTDVLLDVENFPFVTLTESKMGNVWYHKDTDKIFSLTSRGFKLIPKGSKQSLEKNGLLPSQITNVKH